MGSRVGLERMGACRQCYGFGGCAKLLGLDGKGKQGFIISFVFWKDHTILHAAEK